MTVKRGCRKEFSKEIVYKTADRVKENQQDSVKHQRAGNSVKLLPVLAGGEIVGMTTGT